MLVRFAVPPLENPPDLDYNKPDKFKGGFLSLHGLLSLAAQQKETPDTYEYQLFGAILYKSGRSGSSSGHYIASVNRNGQWTLFNDSQVTVNTQLTTYGEWPKYGSYVPIVLLYRRRNAEDKKYPIALPPPPPPESTVPLYDDSVPPPPPGSGGPPPLMKIPSVPGSQSAAAAANANANAGAPPMNRAATIAAGVPPPPPQQQAQVKAVVDSKHVKAAGSGGDVVSDPRGLPFPSQYGLYPGLYVDVLINGTWQTRMVHKVIERGPECIIGLVFTDGRHTQVVTDARHISIPLSHIGMCLVAVVPFSSPLTVDVHGPVDLSKFEAFDFAKHPFFKICTSDESLGLFEGESLSDGWSLWFRLMFSACGFPVHQNG